MKNSGFSQTSQFKDLFNDKINNKILKLKDLEINERLLQTITAPSQRLALPTPPIRLPIQQLPPPPPTHAIPQRNRLINPLPELKSHQILIEAQKNLNHVTKSTVFNPAIEEKILLNETEYIIPKKFIKAYHKQLEIERQLREEKQKIEEENKKQFEDLLISKKKFQKSEKQKQKLKYNENVAIFSTSNSLTRDTKRKKFEAIGIDPQRSDDRRQAKSKVELIDDLKNNPTFIEFIEDGENSPDEFLKLLEKPVSIKATHTSISDTIKKISQTPPGTPPGFMSPYFTPIGKKGPIDIKQMSIFMTPEEIEKEKKKKKKEKEEIDI